jgi:hypothetical protein
MEKENLDKFLEVFKADRSASIEKEASNPLENSHFVTLLESALKGLEYVGYATMDWKLLSIIELTRAYMKEKQAELKQSRGTLDFSNTGFGGSGTYY